MTEWHAPRAGAAGQTIVFFEVASPATGYYLYADCAAGATFTINSDTTGTATVTAPIVGDVIQVEDEDVLIASVAFVSGNRYNINGVYRGYANTTDAAHLAGSPCKLWRDFGNLHPNAATAKHRIVSLPSVTHSAEKALNTISSSISTLVVANGDRQWNNPAWFGTWAGRMVRFYWTAPEEDRGGETSQTWPFYMRAMGTFVIDTIVCKGDVAEIKLVSPDLPLRESRSAESVRDRGWFQNKPARWLLEKLLGSHYHTQRQSPPKYWTSDLSQNIEQTTQGSRPVFSQYGRLPEYDGTNWLPGQDDICRALCYSKDKTALIYGVGDTLYRRDLATMVDSEIGVPTGATGYKIVRLWTPNQGTAIAYGIALRPYVDEGGTYIGNLSGYEIALRQQMIPFKINSDFTATALAVAQSCVGGYHLLTGTPNDLTLEGQNEAMTCDEGLAVPFYQRIAAPTDFFFTGDSVKVSTGPESTDYTASSLFHAEATGMSQWWADGALSDYLYDAAINGYLSRGYRFISEPEIDGTTPRTPCVRHTTGSRGAFAYNKYFSTAGAIYWMKPNTASWTGVGSWISYRLNRIDCATGTIKECTDDTIKVSFSAGLTGPDNLDVPTAMTTAWTGSSVQVFVATHRTNSQTDTGAVQSDNKIIRYLDTAVGSVPTLDATIWDNDVSTSFSLWRYYTVLEMMEGPDGYIHLSGIVRNALYGSAQCYRMAKISKTGLAGGTPTTVNGPYGGYGLSAQVCGMAYVDNVEATDLNYRLWAVDGSGLLLRYSNTSGAWVVEPSVTSLVLEEPSVTGALAVNVISATPADFEIYGVSAPLPSWCGDRTDDSAITWTFPDGKYFLWKVSKKIADRFPLADFSDWSIWDAVSKIAAAMRYVAYFDERGKFRFEPIPSANDSGADYNISIDVPYTDWLMTTWRKAPSLGLGTGEVYNSATAVPYDTVIQQPTEPRLVLAESSPLNTADKPPTIEISCKSVYPVRVILRCVSGGRLLATADARRPAFMLETDTPKTNLVLTQQTAAGSTLYVDHIPLNEYGAFEGYDGTGANGYYVSIGGRDYWDASGRYVTGYDVTAGTLTISTAVNSTNDGDLFPYPAGTTVSLISKSEGFYGSGPTDGTRFTFASGVPLYVGNGLTVKMTAGVASLADEPNFHVGDTLIVETNGLKLDKAERSIQSVVDVASIRAGHGKKEAKIEDNRLLTKATALELARWTVTNYKYPHFELDGAAFPLMPWLRPLDTIHLYDHWTFPNSAVSGLPTKTERVYIRSITHDCRALTTTVSLRGTRDIT